MTTPLTELKGIGASTAEDLQAHDIESVEALAQASISEITKVKGFGGVRALQVKEAAVALLRSREQPTPTPVEIESVTEVVAAEVAEPAAEAANEAQNEAPEKKQKKKKGKDKKGQKDKKEKKGKKPKKK